MKKMTKHFSYILIPALCLIIFQTPALAENGKPENGSLTLTQVLGGFFILILAIMLPLIKRGHSADMNKKKIL